MKSAVLPFWLALAGLCAPPVAAQQASSTDIIVEGHALPAESESAAHAMADQVTATTVGGQVARWVDPLCVRVEGLTEEYAGRVTATISDIAADAGARLAGTRCDANVFVLFTNGADGVAAALTRQDRPMFRQLNAGERERFTRGPGPLRWVARIALRETRRGPLGANSAALMGSGDYNMRIDVPVTDSYDASMVRRPTRASIDGMILVVDVAAAEGLTLNHLSEYAAMVILAQPPMEADFSAFPSVLRLGAYQPGQAPGPRLGEWDRAFLSALYAAPMDRAAESSRSMVAGRMARRLRRP